MNNVKVDEMKEENIWEMLVLTRKNQRKKKDVHLPENGLETATKHQQGEKKVNKFGAFSQHNGFHRFEGLIDDRFIEKDQYEKNDVRIKKRKLLI